MYYSREIDEKETIPYPICSVVAVLKMLIRILNTLRSRIWDMAVFLFSVFWLQKEWMLIVFGEEMGEVTEGCGLFWYCLRDAVMLIRWYRRLSLYTINSLLYCGNISSFSSGWYTFRASSRLLTSPPYPQKTIVFIPSGAKTQKIKRINHCKCNVRTGK